MTSALGRCVHCRRRILYRDWYTGFIAAIINGNSVGKYVEHHRNAVPVIDVIFVITANRAEAHANRFI